MSLWRRRDLRFEFADTGGVLRLWRDVIAKRTAAGEYLVISHEAGIKGEQHTIYSADGVRPPLPVRVLDSRPTVVGGAVRHQLRLAPIEDETTRKSDGEAE